MARKFKVLEPFEHYPSDADPKAPVAKLVEKGDVISNIGPDSIDGLLNRGSIEEVVPKKAGEA